MKKLVLTSLLFTFTASSAPAGDMVRKACLKAARPAASSQLCSCIQRVADQRLKRKDQRLAASFFKDPHKAQEIRQSNKPANAVFWNTYKQFGAAAEQSCGPQTG